MKRLLVAGFAVSVVLSASVAHAGLWDKVKNAVSGEEPNAGESMPAHDVAASKGGVSGVENMSKPVKTKEVHPELIISEDEFSIGDPNAPVKIVEYMATTCGHCAKFHKMSFPQIQKDLINEGKVQFTVRQMVWDPVAMAISKLLACGPKENYFNMLKVYMDTQPQWSKSKNIIGELKKLARMGGLSEEQFGQCLNDKDLHEKLLSVMTSGQDQLNVRSTPTFFVNGERVEGAVPYTTIKNMVDKQL